MKDQEHRIFIIPAEKQEVANEVCSHIYGRRGERTFIYPLKKNNNNDIEAYFCGLWMEKEQIIHFTAEMAKANIKMLSEIDARLENLCLIRERDMQEIFDEHGYQQVIEIHHVKDEEDDDSAVEVVAESGVVEK